MKKSKTLETKAYNSRDTIVNLGDIINKFGIVKKGIIEIVHYTYQGERKSQQHLIKDFTIPIHPVYYEYSNKREYRYTLECKRDAEVIWIDRDEFIDIIKNDGEILYEMLLQESVKGYKTQIQLRCMTYNKVRERLACWIVEMS